MKKIILGTVQLGLPYGINNSTGKPSENEAFRILDLAYVNDILTLDTADGYGTALMVIGAYVKKTKRIFRIINKFKADSPQPLEEKLNHSCDLLRQDSLYCYMYHNFSDYESQIVADQLNDLKRFRKIDKIGVSLYTTEQLSRVVHDPSIDIIQLPVNLLDLSREKEILLKHAKQNGKEIHARSIYLQGIFFKDPATLSGNLMPLRPYLEKLNTFAGLHGVSLRDVSLNHIIKQPFIDHVVLGIDRVHQLEENLAAIDLSLPTETFSTIEVRNEDKYLLNPANWKP